MATVGAGDVLLVSFYGKLFNQTLINTFHYGVSIVAGDPLAKTFCDEVNAKLTGVSSLASKFLACCPAQYTLTFVRVQVIKPLRLAAFQYSNGTGGTSTLDTTTANLAGVVTRRGDLGNRKNVGSLHVPYPSSDAGVTAGTISTDMKTALGALGAVIIAGQQLATVGTIVPVIFNGPTKADVSPISTYIVQDTLRTMRRRNIGLGI